MNATSRRHAVFSMAWTGIGLFALAEGSTDRLLLSYATSIPEELRSILLRRLGTEQRREGLKRILTIRRLTNEYPDLVDLFVRVSSVRHRLAHGHLIYVEPDDPDDEVERDHDDTITEGLGIVGNAGTGHVSTNELAEFEKSADRLVGLLNMLSWEIADRDSPTADDRLQPVGLTTPLPSPRLPLWYSRR